MSAIETVPGRGEQPAARRSSLESIGILLRLALLELRRSPMPLMLPLVAALFWLDALRTGDGLPAIWTQRAAILPDHVLPDLGPISAGMAAWVGGREQRRGMGDLATSTARPRWLRQLAAWGGAVGWTLLAYAACTVVIYTLAARVVPWGDPPVWPVVVTGLAITLFCTAGFVAGALFSSRFTPPLAAVGTLFVSLTVYQRAVSEQSGWVLLSPNARVPMLSWGVFHPVPPDLPIVQTMFYFGLIVLLLGVMGFAGSARSGQLRTTTAIVSVVGLAACVAGFALGSTATLGKYGYEVPSLHSAASDNPIPYTPDCTQGSAIPVCIHPVFASDLPGASATFGPLLAEVAGLPGAPTRVTQIDIADVPVANTGDWSGLTTAANGALVLEFAVGNADTFGEGIAGSGLRDRAVQAVIGRLVAPNGDPGPAQQAVELALSQRAGATQLPKTALPAPNVTAAATRFAALPASRSHAWLVANLDRLRQGQVTLQELP